MAATQDGTFFIVLRWLGRVCWERVHQSETVPATASATVPTTRAVRTSSPVGLENWLELMPMARPMTDQEQRRQSAGEILLLLLVVSWVVWTDSKHILPPFGRTLNVMLSIGTLLWLLLQQPPTRIVLWGTRTLRQQRHDLFWLTIWTCCASICLLNLGYFLNTLGNVRHFDRWLARNFIMEGTQQALLHWLLLPRLNILFPTGIGVRNCLLAGFLFSLLHLPNWPLMVLTFFAGSYWCWWFSRTPNILATWLSHLILASVTIWTLNGPWLANLRVGVGYLYYRG